MKTLSLLMAMILSLEFSMHSWAAGLQLRDLSEVIEVTNHAPEKLKKKSTARTIKLLKKQLTKAQKNFLPKEEFVEKYMSLLNEHHHNRAVVVNKTLRPKKLDRFYKSVLNARPGLEKEELRNELLVSVDQLTFSEENNEMRTALYQFDDEIHLLKTLINAVENHNLSNLPESFLSRIGAVILVLSILGGSGYGVYALFALGTALGITLGVIIAIPVAAIAILGCYIIPWILFHE
jgi:hypothetical protein